MYVQLIGSVCVCVCDSSDLAEVDLKVAGTHFQLLLGVLRMLHQLEHICRCIYSTHQLTHAQHTSVYMN